MESKRIINELRNGRREKKNPFEICLSPCQSHCFSRDPIISRYKQRRSVLGISGMTCLSDGSCSCCCGDSLLNERMVSRWRFFVNEADRHSASNGIFLAEKVFPVYAMGISRPEIESNVSVSDSGDPIWENVRKEAKLEAENEPILSSFLYASILSHDCLEQALGFVLANRLHNPTLLATQLVDIFNNIMMSDEGIKRSIRLDIQAFKERDPACFSYSSILLYLKGYHSLQSYRVAHALWKQGRQVLALALQSRISEVFGVDIHPGMLSLFSSL
ncbi:hypothetical protein SAY86_026588 [Trapa natans]|uniref:Serine acetyltransferase N-terminal domain-containing protein n=1 Tax=Trapa natans TaxID=22666 RepID=A0AAN7QF69_TRANT|nr:hypothetical protein SAY86_026588 [Trapa natans]